MIIFSICRICYKDSPEKDFEGDFCCVCFCKFIIIFIYLAIFLGFFLYILLEYTNKNHKSYEKFKKIEADKFIEDFIYYFCPKKDIELKTLKL